MGREGIFRGSDSAEDVLTVSAWPPAMKEHISVLQRFGRGPEQELVLHGEPELLLHSADDATEVEIIRYASQAPSRRRPLSSNVKRQNYHMNPVRRATSVAVLLTLLPPLAGLAQPIEAPNFIPITPLLATSGQPAEQALRALGTRGFQAVVYLAPGTVPNAVHSEAELLSAQGIEFIQIPIPFGAPDDSHVRAVFAALNRLRDKKTLVHCEINMRASTMVFLYRAIELREDPATAYQAVAQVWSPRGAWRRLAVDELAKSDLKFEPY